MTALSSLSEFDPIPAPESDDRERFRVYDDSAASWAMRKLRAIREKQAEIIKIAEAERERIETWAHDAVSSLAPDEAYFTGLLTDYARRERTESGRKTIDLPHGKIKSRAAQPKYVFTDPAAFIAWAKETGHADLVRVKEEPDLTAVKAVLRVPQIDDWHESAAASVIDPASGEVAPGVEVELRGATYAVEVAV